MKGLADRILARVRNRDRDIDLGEVPDEDHFGKGMLESLEL